MDWLLFIFFHYIHTTESLLHGENILNFKGGKIMKKCRVSTYRNSVLLLALLLAACGGQSGGGGGASSAVLDSAGGTLTGPDGVQVVFPSGALDQPTAVTITRNSTGAPAVPEGYTVAGSIYEITPHDQPFNLPVTIRLPVPSGSTGTSVFVASPGQDWSMKDASVVNGMAVLERGSFSWFAASWSCFTPASMINDPYWCLSPGSYALINATPTQALTQISAPTTGQNGSGWYDGAGSYRVDQAATLHFQSVFNFPGHCRNVMVTLSRSRFNTSSMKWDLPQTIMTNNHPDFTVDGYRKRGTAILDVPFTFQDNGKNTFYLKATAECPALYHRGVFPYWDYSNYRTVTAGIDSTFVESNITPPAALYTVGGSITGLTGTGLVLQNNGGDDFSASVNGPFTFATPVAGGPPYSGQYSVSVLTQPSGQNCTVQNGSGTASANVTNVAVSCVDLPIVISPVNPSAYGCSTDTVTFTASKGTPPYTWSSSEPANGSNLFVINATQAQWIDGHDYYCSAGSTVTITVTDAAGASASSVITVLK